MVQLSQSGTKPDRLCDLRTGHCDIEAIETSSSVGQKCWSEKNVLIPRESRELLMSPMCRQILTFRPNFKLLWHASKWTLCLQKCWILLIYYVVRLQYNFHAHGKSKIIQLQVNILFFGRPIINRCDSATVHSLVLLQLFYFILIKYIINNYYYEIE